jgi:uncharacterized membrane protein
MRKGSEPTRGALGLTFPKDIPMLTLPLHPAVVHLPLALALVVPPLALAIFWAMRTGRLPAKAWLLVVGLQSALFSGALVALQTGERDEDRFEERLSAAALEVHQHSAQQFTLAAGVTLALAGVALLASRGRRQGVAVLATIATSLVVAGLALRVGQLGGELVYGVGGLGDEAARSQGWGGMADRDEDEEEASVEETTSNFHDSDAEEDEADLLVEQEASNSHHSDNGEDENDSADEPDEGD